jgi:hypothetical protein
MDRLRHESHRQLLVRTATQHVTDPKTQGVLAQGLNLGDLVESMAKLVAATPMPAACIIVGMFLILAGAFHDPISDALRAPPKNAAEQKTVSHPDSSGHADMTHMNQDLAVPAAQVPQK